MIPAPSLRLAIGLMLLGMFMFALNDAMGKWLVATYTVGQVLLIRSAFGMAFLAPFAGRAGFALALRPERPGLQALRVAFSSAEVFCFYWAVRSLPLADVMTVWLAAPIIVAALSPFLLGESVDLRRWIAIGIGFVGVVIALAPSGMVQFWPVMAAMVGTVCFAMMLITGRTLRGTPDTTLVLWQLAGAGLVGLVLAPMDWVMPTARDFLLLGLLGIVAMLAHLCVNRALKLADAAVVAPFQYTLLPYAAVLGWLFFGDIPHPQTFAGAAIIILSGLYLFFQAERTKVAS
jgi:drug/metabolite transporter (DMT)-like permease